MIADDHAIVREGLVALITAQDGLVVVAEAATGEEAWQKAREVKPDVLLLDVSMPNMGGAEVTERIVRECPTVRVVALTMHEERGYVSRLLRAGASGYVLKRTASSVLLNAVREVAAGGRYVDPSLAGALLTDRATPQRRASGGVSDASLSRREEEVLRLLATGHSNKEIAAILSISVKTVETHRAGGMAKLGITTRAALVRFLLAEGWLRDA